MRFIEQRNAKRVITKSIVVFYHADCTDGFTAAWVLWKKFGNKADYVPTYFEGDEYLGLKGKEIYMVDVVFGSKSVMDHLLKNNKRVTVIDHHVSVKDITLGTYKPSYAVNHCGCVLAWQYFFGTLPMPKLLSYIEDVDIWVLKYKGSKDLFCYLDLVPFEFKAFSKVITDFENPQKRKKILNHSALLAEHESRLIDINIEQNARLVKLDGHVVYAINSDGSKSETGHRLAKKKPPFAIVWTEKKDVIAVSLRGIGNTDLSKIAEKYGGGGHKLSAAFRFKSLKDIPWKSIK